MTLNLDALLRVPDVETAGCTLHPDGWHVAFAWNKTGQWEIYQLELPSNSSTNSPTADFGITQVSSGIGSKFTPRYSPDGKYLAWLMDLTGSEDFHLVLHDIGSGQTHDLTPDIDFTIQPTFAWSPDSKQIAYLADPSGNFDLYILDIHSPLPAGDGLEMRALFSPSGPAHFVRWARDGHHLVVSAEQEWQTDGTFIVPLDGRPPRRIGGDAALDAIQPVWSPDGTKVAFSSNSTGWAQIGIFHLEDDHIEWLTSDEGDKNNAIWSEDGTHLAWIHNHGETAWVEIRSMDGSQWRVQTEAGFAFWPTFTMDGKSVLFVYENPHQPPDLWLAALDDGRLTQLTNSLPAELKAAESEFIIPEPVTFPSLDGTPIPALLYKPKGAGPHSPAVVVIHGGPAWHFGYYWHPFMAHLASRGWTVLAPNYRGSTGYGRAWMVANRFEMGRLDNDDCAAAALYLAREGLADPKKIGVTGRSHGGYLTMTCLTRQPELWAVGSAVVPFLNWFTGHENSREDLQYWDIQNMGDPETHHDLWHERSPFFFLDKVRSPVQFICGETDPRCPPSESTEAHEKLQSLGIPSELLLYEGEGHGFLKLENVIDSDVKRVEFLAKALES